MQGNAFQQGTSKRQLYEMSLGYSEEGCFLVQSVGGKKGEEISFPDPSHFPSSTTLSVPFRDWAPPHSQVALLSHCSSCSGSQVSHLQLGLHLSPEVLRDTNAFRPVVGWPQVVYLHGSAQSQTAAVVGLGRVIRGSGDREAKRIWGRT